MKQRYRVYPHPHQQVVLAKVFGCARVFCDDALARSHGFHKKERKGTESKGLGVDATLHHPGRADP